MAGETIGWGGEFWLADDAAQLTELIGVIELTIPEDAVDEVETTHYKSPGKRREYIGGLITGGSFTVSMNYVAGSETDELCRGARGKVRSFRIGIPGDTGAVDWDIAGSVLVTGYTRNVPLDDRLTAQLTMRMTGDLSEAES